MSTPLMKQYAQVKSRYPGTILLFRMGDFFETFEEDAKVTAQVLGITLTRRGNGTAGEVPLAGFPHHALDSYLPKLIRAGHKVAVCEQVEDPKLAKGIVRRDVIEVVTPGVAYSDRVLQQKLNNYLAAVALPTALATGTDMVGFAYVDVSTGEFSVTEFPLGQLQEQLDAVSPSELLVQKRDATGIQELLGTRFSGIYSKVDDWIFHFDYAHELLLRHFRTTSLKGFGAEELRSGILASGAIMHYLQETQKANLGHIRKLVPVNVSDSIVLDAATKRNLEISSALGGGEDGSLISVLDKTTTPMGGRLLRQWITRPLKRIGAIRERLEGVRELAVDDTRRTCLREILSRIGDLERLNAKICTGRATPREVVALKLMQREVRNLKAALEDMHTTGLSEIRDSLNPLTEAVNLIGLALEDDPPPQVASGGVIRKSYHQELDELRMISSRGKDWIAELQQKERERTGISSLKVGFNNVFGYYLEITNTHKEKIPGEYIRKQTLTNAERYITPDLKQYEEKVLHAQEKILALETQLFDELRTTLSRFAEEIRANACMIARLDVLVSFAVAGSEYGYVCPEVDESIRIEILDGRHPVIERYLPPGDPYTHNDTRLDANDSQIMIITGPNMSGKSSYLRQAGLIVLLAQIGSFVPARGARIGIVDRIYTRVGASDNIASGESTFLVEMHEAANIVNTATDRSLVLLDEVGRGTSTFDGISIAWALTEYLHEHVGARTLFATHYHELNELADRYPRIRNFKVDVREYGDKVIFLHKVLPGTADHSYGIQVAQMAGLPEEITERAKSILKNLEGTELTVQGEGHERNARGRIGRPEVQLSLFELKDDALREELKSIEVDRLTPLQALELLAALKEKYLNHEQVDQAPSHSRS